MVSVASVANCLTILDLWVVNIAYPTLRQDFAPASLSDVSWVLNVYTIVLAALLIPAGRLADNLGRRRCFFSGLILFGIASVGCAVAPTLFVLIASRGLQAVGASVLMPTSLGLAMSAFGERRRGTAVGIWAALGAVAASAGPVLGGLLIAIDWRWIFLINIPLVAGTVLVGRRYLPLDGVRRSRRLDLLGALLILVAAGLVCTALVEVREWPGEWIWSALAAAGILVPVLVVHLKRHPDPILAPGLLTVIRLRAGVIGILSYYTGFAAILLGTTLLLTNTWHYSALRTALAIAPGPLVASVIAPFSGRLIARFGFHSSVLIGSASFGLAGLWSLLTAGDTPAYGASVLPSLVLWGVANGLIQPALFGTASAAAADDLSSASAVLTTARQLGSALGVALLVAMVTTGSLVGLAGLRRGWLIVLASAIVTGIVGLRAPLGRSTHPPRQRRTQKSQL
ncbi:MFS transporter [Flindersiella endophytica]